MFVANNLNNICIDLHKWLMDCIQKDIEDIRAKGLEYMIEPYVDIQKQLTKVLSDDIKNQKLMSTIKEDCNYLDNISDNQKPYRHYNRLLSWYSLIIKFIEKGVKPLRL